ncbi:MAG TPA: hypothetical protein VD788_09470 [Candidatus Polarisedimenticolaceae bacterium]|nr:hypothetical protein [Candidatus Polarisedimenticolaceae bacterium]
MDDFDFLVGRNWHVRNRVRVERLANCDEWTEFDARLLDVRKILGGLGNIDRFSARRDGKPFEAVSLRLFNPSSGLWTIYWADNVSATLTEQVTGRFVDGVGEFLGRETYRGQTVELRFRWTDVTERSPRWEQAYLDESTGEWETNWIMRFTELETR